MYFFDISANNTDKAIRLNSDRKAALKMINLIFALAPAATAFGRIMKMTNTAMNCIKGIGIGLALGAAAGLVCKRAADSRRHSWKYKARHAADVMEDMLENVVYMFK